MTRSELTSWQHDRNFDDLADRFSSRIYGGLKGQLRRAVVDQDLKKVLPNNVQDWNVLDLGGGLGAFSVDYAKLGCNVVYNDISQNMMRYAQDNAAKEAVSNRIVWKHGPYQSSLDNYQNTSKFNLTFCHAVLEWLADPKAVLDFFAGATAQNGVLSLCLYNPVGLIYHNLIRGNFSWIERSEQQEEGRFASDKKGLTPTNPVEFDEAKVWLEQAGFSIHSVSGIRVFSDYVRVKTGGNALPEEVIKQELKYSVLEPYKWMGRYLHIVAIKHADQ